MKIKRYIGKDNSLIFVNKSKTNFSLKLHPLKRKKIIINTKKIASIEIDFDIAKNILTQKLILESEENKKKC
jgi:ribosomal protein S24E